MNLSSLHETCHPVDSEAPQRGMYGPVHSELPQIGMFYHVDTYGDFAFGKIHYITLFRVPTGAAHITHYSDLDSSVTP